jgi:acetyl esterase
MSAIRRAEDIPNQSVRNILAQMDVRGNSATVPVEQKRAAQLAAVQRAGKPEDVSSIEQVTVPGRGGHSIPVRIYRPQEDSRNLPVVTYFHGGGFFAGNLETHDPVCRAIARRTPAVVISVDYRLAPEHRWPAALEDCLDVLAWTERTISPSRVVVAGDSAGGNLAASVALECNAVNKGLISGQVLVYPMLDATMSLPAYVENALVPPFTLLDCVYVWQLFLPRRADRLSPRISPLYAPAQAFEGLPRTLVLSSEFDILRDDAIEYLDALRQNGIHTEHQHYAEMPHGFLLWGGTVAAAHDALSRIAAFVRSL